MKTLNQRIENYVRVFIIEYHAQEIAKDILREVKEWLQEHQPKAVLNKNNGLHYIPIEELIKELEQ